MKYVIQIRVPGKNYNFFWGDGSKGGPSKNKSDPGVINFNTEKEAEACAGNWFKDGAVVVVPLIDIPSSESQQRKDTPVWSGVLQYFPLAIGAVARLSKKGNDKHNPGEPLHWARDKSNDHGDCIVRHQMNPAEVDPDNGELHAVAVAWRALAQLQLLEEKRLTYKALDAIADVVLAFRPKPKTKPARRRKRQAAKIRKEN